jgi:hypothetical protein
LIINEAIGRKLKGGRDWVVGDRRNAPESLLFPEPVLLLRELRFFSAQAAMPRGVLAFVLF